MSRPRMIKVRCSDGVVLEIEEAVAIRSGMINRAIEDGYGDDVILLSIPSFDTCRIFRYLDWEYKYLGNELANVIALAYLYLTKIEQTSALDARILEEELKNRDDLEELNYQKAEFVNVNDVTLFELIRAVDYLDIPELLDLTRQNLFDRMERNTSIDIPWDIRELFEIQEKVLRENQEKVLRNDQLLLRNEQWAELNALM